MDVRVWQVPASELRSVDAFRSTVCETTMKAAPTASPATMITLITVPCIRCTLVTDRVSHRQSCALLAVFTCSDRPDAPESHSVPLCHTQATRPTRPHHSGPPCTEQTTEHTEAHTPLPLTGVQTVLSTALYPHIVHSAQTSIERESPPRGRAR